MTPHVNDKILAQVRRGVYSVWNWKRGKFDYYGAPPGQSWNFGEEVKPPPPSTALGELGADPDVSGHVLPRGARYLGSGNTALGEVASAENSGAGVGSWTAVVLAIAIPSALLYAVAHLNDLFGKSEEL